ncbi:DMT family transporter [Kitasatospora cineracea]|uniref:Drug/metabolite transporter (DMT)-like permease n=1 Tax=Kitasatospora cineracea TaxID=88074 RepID=A0A8G1X9Y8_9ACTN|nr:DMT family transporter [Kitasatospora cineracea]ROR42620.1 drug/metabolite transporter (DMT)-like permease [Kitasatospora cineracea]
MAVVSIEARPQLLRDLPLLAVAVVWGSSFWAVRQVAEDRTVVAVLVLRFGVVLPVLGVVAWRRLRGLSFAQWGGGAVLGVVLGAVFLLETYGVVHTSATNAGLVISLTMVFTPLAEAVLRRSAPPVGFLAAVGVSVLGVALLTGLRAPSVGDLLVLGAAVARTVNVLATARLRSVRGVDALALTWVQLAFATVVFALAAPFAGPSPLAVAASFDVARWGLLLYLSLLCTLFAFFVQLWAVRATSPSRVSLLLGTEPLWAALCGVLLAGDRPGRLALLGAVAVLVGTEWGRRRAPRFPAAGRELVNEGSSGRHSGSTGRVRSTTT